MGLPCSKIDIAIDDAVMLEVAFKTNDLQQAGVRLVNLVDQRAKMTKASKALVDTYAKRFINLASQPEKVPELVRS